MIDYKELMIGNYVLYNGHEATVYSIRGPIPIWGNKPAITLSCNGLITVTEDELEPMPVTKEVLERFGFKPAGPKNTFLSRGLHVMINDFGAWMTWRSVELYAVHVLQNHYYSVTGLFLTPQNKPSDNVDSSDGQSD